ncbi:MAG: hypothetical protein JWQ61_3111 [Collimonas fungivorans]|uniref:Ig-like domain-containing protein n=1 Tax=Collimonas fungivorans TaxID=158899 RepID=UPI0026E95A9C|nr:Ig-like domain-containing protein [Collimonas fungivorans]MDB5768297.1 hypothetical protein [Collimonas fungivorans]
MNTNEKNIGAPDQLNDLGNAALLAEATQSLAAAGEVHAGVAPQEAPASLAGQAVGVMAAPSIERATDKAGHATGDVGNGATIDDVRPTIWGRGAPGTDVDIYDNGKLLGSAYVDNRGNWKLNVPAADALNTGEHVLTVVNAAGETSEPFALNIEIPESSRPVIETVSDNFGAAGEIANGGTTDDATPTLRGHGEAGGQVLIYDNNVLIDGAFIGQDGNWTFDFAKPLAAGEHVLKVVQNGIASEPFALTVGMVEMAKPVIDAAFDDVGATGVIANGGATDDNQPTFSGHGEPNTLIVLFDNNVRIGAVWSNPEGGWSLTSVPLAPGEHVLTIANTGNEAVKSEPYLLTIEAPAVAKLTIDSVYDDIGVSGVISSGGTTDDTYPSFRGHGEPGTQVFLYEGNAIVGRGRVNADGSWSLSPDSFLAAGEHEFTVRGNSGVASEPFVLNVQIPEVAKLVIESAYDDVGASGAISSGGTTDDTYPSFRGHGEPGTQVFLYEGNAIVGRGRVNADGSWSLSPDGLLTSGAHEFTVRGNSGVASEPFVLNVQIPEVAKLVIDSVYDAVGVSGVISSGGTTDDTHPSFRGHGEPGTQVFLYEGDTLVGRGRVNADGSWSLSPNGLLTTGEHAFTVRGGEGVVSEPFVLNVQTHEAARLVIDSVYDDFGVSGVISNGGATDDSNPSFRGHGEPGTQVFLFEGDTQVGRGQVNADGSWSLSPEGLLAIGQHEFTVRGAGVTSEPFALTVTAPDSAKPVIESVFDNIGTVGDVANGGTTDDARPTFHGHGQPDTYVFLYDGNTRVGAALVDPEGSWTLNVIKPLAPGEHLFTVNGEGLTSEPFALILDNVPETPKPVIESAIDDVGATGVILNGGTTDDYQPVFHGHAEPDAPVIVFYDNGINIGSSSVGADGSWTFELIDQYQSINLAPGDHSITASTDGVIFSDPFVLHVTEATPAAAGVDSLASVPTDPVIDSISDNFGANKGNIGNGGTTDDVTPTLYGHAEPNTRFTLYDNGIRIADVTADAEGSWWFGIPFMLQQGEHSFTVAVAGDDFPSAPFVVHVGEPYSTQPEINFALDNFHGNSTVGNGGSTDDTTPLLRGHAQPSTLVKLYDNGIQIGEASADRNGDWSYTVKPPLPSGSHAFTVVDGSGTSSDAFTLHVSAPEALPNSLGIDSAYDNYGATANVSNGGITDDQTPTLHGHAAPLSQVTVYDHGAVLGSADVNADGAWAFDVSKLAMGEHSFTIADGGVSSDPFVLQVGPPTSARPAIDSVTDHVGHETGDIAWGSTTDDARPTLHGHGEPFADLYIYDTPDVNGSSVLLGIANPDAEGNWSFTVADKLSNGEHNFTVVGSGVVGFDVFTFYVNEDSSTPAPAVDHVGGMAGESDAAAAAIHDSQPAAEAVKADANGNPAHQPELHETLKNGEHVLTAAGDGQVPDALILHMDAFASNDVQADAAAHRGLALSVHDLLQPAAELFGGQPEIHAATDSAHPVDMATFGSGVDVPQFVETSGGASAPVHTAALTDELLAA